MEPLQSTVRLQHLIQFSTQMALMLKVGVPLHRALQMVRTAHNRETVEAIGVLVDSGNTLSSALAHQAGQFDPLYLRMVRMGEESGALVAVLERLAADLERRGRVQSQLRQALVYPACLLATSMLLLAWIVFGMAPRFMEVSRQAGVGEAPALTRFVTEWVLNPAVVGWALLLTVLAAQLGWLAWRNPESRGRVVEGMRQVPLVGPWLRLRGWTRWARDLESMLVCGVDLARALGFLGEERLEHHLREGKELHEALVAVEAPRMLVGLVMVGEATGRLPRMLGAYADLGEQELAHRLELMLALVEPLVLSGMGLVVGLTVLAALLPIIQLASANL